MRYIDLYIDNLSIDGKGIGFYKDKRCYIIGALPNEKVKAEIIKEKKDYIEGLFVENLSDPNPLRIPPQEKHYLSTSYLQIIPYKNQIQFKMEAIKKMFSKFANTEIARLQFTQSPQEWGYRNKIEFSFTEKDNELYLAFHKRGYYDQKIPLDEGSKLAHPRINKIADVILNVLRKTKVKSNHLKTLVTRYSYYTHGVTSLLLFKDEFVQKNTVEINNLINLISRNNEITNIIIASSSGKNPRPTVHEIIFQKGENNLIEKINNYYFEYSYNDFFQNNIPVFSKVIKKIQKFINKNDKILELYGGVGCIGISLASQVQSVTSIEVVESSTENALKNATRNNIVNYNALCLKSEEISDKLFENINILIVDPPRTGLHKKVIKKIIKFRPQRIIYLSCNPISQASDFNFLKEMYQITYIHGYDFYPQTEHIENLLILDRK